MPSKAKSKGKKKKVKQLEYYDSDIMRCILPIDTPEKKKNKKEEVKFMEYYEELKDKVINHYNEAKELKSMVLRLGKMYENDINKAIKTKNGKLERAGGINTKKKVPDKLAEYIGIDKGTEMSRPEVAKEIHAVLNQRGLKDKNNRKIMRADKETMKVFGLDDYVNTVEDPDDLKGFTFRTLPTYIAKIYKEYSED